MSVVDPVRKNSYRNSLDLYVFPWLKLTEAEKSEKTDACLMRYSRWSLKEFDEVCKAVQDTISYGRFPSPRQMLDQYELVGARQGWKQEAQAATPKCSRCGGVGLIGGYTIRLNPPVGRIETDYYVKHKQDGTVYSACYPCPQCNSALVVEPSKVAASFEPATREEFLAQRDRATEAYKKILEERERKKPTLVIDAEYAISPEVKQAIANKSKPAVEPTPIKEVMEAALTAPAPKRNVPDGFEEF